MRIELTSRPRQPIIIVGFPGVGLVGPIVTEFLIDHMKTEQIGRFVYDELPPTAAIHKGKLVHPMSVHYSAQYNAVIIYTILGLKKQEWAVAQAVAGMAKELDAKEILCIDGANTIGDEDEKLYFFGDAKLAEHGASKMDESVIMGVSGALLLTTTNTNCIFASTKLEMPDSKAAAEVVKFLDKYLGLQVDYQPLLEQAQHFEEKLKGMLGQKALNDKDRKSMEYLG
jgi:uncharacterized protein